MLLWDFFDRRAHRMGILDTKLVQAAAIFFALAVVKLVPTILELSVWWFVALAAICAAHPVWVFFGPEREDVPQHSSTR